MQEHKLFKAYPSTKLLFRLNTDRVIHLNMKEVVKDEEIYSGNIRIFSKMFVLFIVIMAFDPGKK